MPANQPASSLVDPDRLTALRQLGLLDTPAEEAFDRLTRLTSRMLDVPVALVSLVDENRQFFKSCVGLPEPWATERETPLSHSFCQHAVASKKPLVIEDAREHPLVKESLAIVDLNVVAYAGIPLVTSKGLALGSFCAIDSKPRRWSERELEFLTGMAASAMTEIELRAENAERRRAQSLLAAEREVLERIGRGETLQQVLEALTQEIEQQTEAGLCSVLLLNAATGTLHLAAAPHLRQTYAEAIEGLPIGEGVGSCGTAAHRNEPVVVSDTQKDPLWCDYRDLAREHGLIASWAHPIRGIDGAVLGTFAIYYGSERTPGPHERHVVERAAYLAAIAIDRARRDERIRTTQEGASETLTLLRSVIEGITDPIFAKDLQGNYTLANSAFGNLVGQSVDGILGRTDAEFFPAQVVQEMRSIEDRVVQIGRSETSEEWIRGADGESRFYLITSAPRRDAAGDVVGTLGIARDITARKRVDVVLRQSEASYRSLFDSLGELVYVLDLEGTHLNVNEAVLRRYGYTREEVLSAAPTLLSDPDRNDPQELRQHWEQVLRGKSPCFEGWGRTKNGESFPQEITFAKGEYFGAPVVIAVARDITERKRAEAALRESESRYSALIDQAADAIFIHDDQGAILDVNREACQSLGYGREELLQMRVPDIAVPEPEGMALPEVFQAISRGETVAAEGWNRRKDGTLLPVEVRVGPVRIGEEVQFLAIARDITERRTAEARLLESEERFRQLAENIDSVFWLYDLVERRYLYVSPAYECIWGRPRETVYDDPTAWLEAVHPEDREKVRPVSLEALEDEYATEYRVIRPDGEVRTILDRGFPVRNDRGEIIRAAGIAEDITPLAEVRQRLSEREAHYRRLVTTAPEGIYALDAEGHFVELNPAGEEMLERPAAEVLGEHFATVVLPEDLPVAERVFTEILSGAEGKIAFELRIIRPSGEHRLFQLAATGIQEGDQITGLHGIARDITEERAREHTMRLLTAALESFEEGISLTTARDEVLYANTALTHILGIEPEAAQELDVPSLLPDDAAREQYGEMHHALATEGRWSGRVWRRRLSDGQVIPLDMIAGAVQAPDGERNLFFVVHEATEEIERENRLRRVERLASLGTLIGGVAHELNNPLHAILNFAELMLLDERDADDRESLELVKREADRAAKVVSDLRLTARDTQAEKSQRASVDLNDVVRHVLKLRRYSLETGNVEVREDLARDLPAVLANRGEMEQVVLNLVINAEQAMAGQAGEKRLILRTRRTRRGASVHVVDSGPGIPAQHLDRIFDPFYTTKSPGEGTGLGLSLVHSIVSEHEGEIEVESEPGKGTAFRVDVPPASTAETSGSQESSASTPARSLRILVVDDEDAIRLVTVRFLERRGHHVDAAREGGEALRLLEGTDYDVIISDLRMPGLGGEELFTRLREQGQGKEHRLIFVTGDAASAQTARMVSEANVPMLIKPVRLDDLARAVETIQEGSSSAD